MNSKYLEFGYNNSRNVTVIPTRNDYRVNSIDTEITDIMMGEEPLVSLGDILSFDEDGIKYSYVCNKITELEDRSFLVQESAINICNQFILPLILPTINVLGSKGFYNTYLDKELDKFYVVFRFSKDADYMKLEEVLAKSLAYIDKTDYKSGFVVFTYRVNNLESVMKQFKKGEYSKFPFIIKEKIMRGNTSTHIKDVLLKSKDRRIALEERLGMKLSPDIELASKPTEVEFYDHFVDNIITKLEDV